MLLPWQNPSQSLRHFHSAELLVLFFPSTGYPWAGSHNGGSCSRSVPWSRAPLWMWAQLESQPLLGACPLLGARPLCATRPPTAPRAPQIPSHMDLPGWSRNGSARTLHAVSSLFLPCIHPCPGPKELFWKGSSSQQLNPIHVRHEMPQAALRHWQEMQWFPS